MEDLIQDAQKREAEENSVETVHQILSRKLTWISSPPPAKGPGHQAGQPHRVAGHQGPRERYSPGASTRSRCACVIASTACSSMPRRRPSRCSSRSPRVSRSCPAWTSPNAASPRTVMAARQGQRQGLRLARVHPAHRSRREDRAHVLDKSNLTASIDKLGLDDSTFKQIKTAIDAPHG